MGVIVQRRVLIDMEENTILPKGWESDNSIIKVIGVGGGGCNAVTYMYNSKVQGCSFIVCNTDSQVLQKSPVPVKIQLGEGLGAGTDPIKGRNAALESADLIEQTIFSSKTEMLFITAGMGGGTGTGAAPVIAEIARKKGVLTVGVVTLPFKNERNGSLSKAISGIKELGKNVDSLLVIDNEKLLEVYGDLLLKDLFPKTDEVLSTAVQCILSIIQNAGYINVDFRDVKTMMKDSGYALMGSGTGSGKDRLNEAVKNAMASPLLLAFDPRTAKNALINITCGSGNDGLRGNDITVLDEKLANYLGKANRFKRGIVFSDDPEFGDKVSITVIATGIKVGELESVLRNPEENDLIIIDENYVYDPDSQGLKDVEDDGYKISKVGMRTRIKFHFDEDEIPLLCVNEGDDLSELEHTTAYSRLNGNNM